MTHQEVINYIRNNLKILPYRQYYVLDHLFYYNNNHVYFYYVPNDICGGRSSTSNFGVWGFYPTTDCVSDKILISNVDFLFPHYTNNTEYQYFDCEYVPQSSDHFDYVVYYKPSDCEYYSLDTDVDFFRVRKNYSDTPYFIVRTNRVNSPDIYSVFFNLCPYEDSEYLDSFSSFQDAMNYVKTYYTQKPLDHASVSQLVACIQSKNQCCLLDCW